MDETTPASGSGSAEPDGNSAPPSPGSGQPNFLAPREPSKEPRSPLPWIIAAVVVVVVIIGFLVAGHHTAESHPSLGNPGGTAMAAPAAYAAHLTISNLAMSQATSGIAAMQTYIDGDITNRGDKTLTGAIVQVGFFDFNNHLAQKETMPLRLIFTHKPYIETEPVSSAPIKPGQTRQFHLIFDHVTSGWNQNYPEIRVIRVKTQ